MAPLSILPGRIRFETPLLNGRPGDCRHFESRIEALAGVMEASANHRTGRILIRFDEEAVNRHDLADQIERALATVDDKTVLPGGQVSPSRRQGLRKEGGASSHIARHILLDVVTHAILPAPLDLLLPTAAAVFRR